MTKTYPYSQEYETNQKVEVVVEVEKTTKLAE
jgi:hypothetical protein